MHTVTGLHLEIAPANETAKDMYEGVAVVLWPCCGPSRWYHLTPHRFATHSHSSAAEHLHFSFHLDSVLDFVYTLIITAVVDFYALTVIRLEYITPEQLAF